MVLNETAVSLKGNDLIEADHHATAHCSVNDSYVP